MTNSVASNGIDYDIRHFTGIGNERRRPKSSALLSGYCDYHVRLGAWPTLRLRPLTQVVARLLSGNIGHKRAGQILYRLQTASVNLRTASLGPGKANNESSQKSRELS
jgi:hypothetical protein